MLSSKGPLMHFITALSAGKVWKIFMLMVSPSLMGQQVHDSISGHLQLDSLKVLTRHRLFCVLATRTSTGHFKFPHNYFCDTGNGGNQHSNIAYSENPLWDGEGCGPSSTCCQLNNPPWFCTTLPQPTTDDIELRICGDNPTHDEDVFLQLVDMYVM